MVALTTAEKTIDKIAYVRIDNLFNSLFPFHAEIHIDRIAKIFRFTSGDTWMCLRAMPAAGTATII